MGLIYGIVSFISGACSTVQAGVNGCLNIKTESPLYASFISFLGGVMLLIILLFTVTAAGLLPFPSGESLWHTKWWMWCGGPLGAIFVMAAVLLPARMGFTAYFGMIVAGQLTGSVIADHIGWLGNEAHPINGLRMFGIACLIGGAVLVQREKRLREKQ